MFQGLGSATHCPKSNSGLTEAVTLLAIACESG
jgi:hypothetical protein